MRRVPRIRPILDGGMMVSLLLLSASASYGAAIDVNLNDDAVRGVFVVEAEARRLEVDFGWLHHEDDGEVANVGLQVVGSPGGGSNWRVGVGGKLFYFDANVADGSAVGLGGFARYRIPNSRVEVTGFVYYAPDVVAFGDAEKYLETGLRVGYRVMENASVYLGLRRIRADFGGPSSVTIDSGAHAGFRIHF